MQCNEMQDLLADYLGGGLDPPRREACEAHLKECPACRGEVASLTDTLNVLRRLEAPSAAPRRSRWRRIALFHPLGYAATLLIGLGLGWSLKPAPFREGRPITAVNIETVSAQLGLHPDWVDAAMRSSGGSPPASPFARNLVTLARALSEPRS